MATIMETTLNSCNKSNHTGKTIRYNTISQAERALNTRHITDVLKGKRNSAKGYTFEYQKEVI